MKRTASMCKGSGNDDGMDGIRGRATHGHTRRAGTGALGAVAVGLLWMFAGSGVARATPMPLGVRGQLSVRVGSTTAFTSAELSGVVTIDAEARTLTVPAGLLATAGSFPGATPVASFSISNAAALLRPGGATTGTCPGPLSGAGACVLGGALGGGLGGSMPLSGTIAIGTAASAVVLPASVIGAGGLVSASGVALQGAPWTARTAAVTTTGPTMSWTTAMGTAPASWLAYQGNATSRPVQHLNLVTPIHVAFGDTGRTAVFVTLDLRAIPEPGSATLVGLGLLGLAATRLRHTRAAASRRDGR